MARVGVLIPTMDNRGYLEPCLRSLRATTSMALSSITVLNNGQHGSCDFALALGAVVVEMGHNAGWEGGLAEGVRLTTEEHLLFCNDDVFFPSSSTGWMMRLLGHMSDARIGACGPQSNYASGYQNMWRDVPAPLITVPALIGFCMLVRRSALERAGGVALDCPCADDRDLSIRLGDAGYLLLVDRSVFVYHHGAVTGAKLMGSVYEPGGWYGADTLARHRAHLVAKHGEARIAAHQAQEALPYVHPTRRP